MVNVKPHVFRSTEVLTAITKKVWFCTRKNLDGSRLGPTVDVVKSSGDRDVTLHVHSWRWKQVPAGGKKQCWSSRHCGVLWRVFECILSDYQNSLEFWRYSETFYSPPLDQVEHDSMYRYIRRLLLQGFKTPLFPRLTKKWHIQVRLHRYSTSTSETVVLARRSRFGPAESSIVVRFSSTCSKVVHPLGAARESPKL